jgi:2-polyprenyl-3-methyl-5-hydroxy-6-metoxy-1,4-benzoquinol methylase
MNYIDIYKETFNNVLYSSEHHIQYDIIIDIIKKLNLPNNNIIDIGSGRGHLIKILKENIYNNLSIVSVDLKKFHTLDVTKFIECDLSKESDRNNLLDSKYDVLICTDVFEHLDKSFIEDVVSMCAKLSDNCIFGIANHSDIWNGVELHTIQENDKWWDNIILKYFNITNKSIHFNGKLYMYTCNTKVT